MDIYESLSKWLIGVYKSTHKKGMKKQKIVQKLFFYIFLMNL